MAITPMIQQYLEIKEQYQGHILFFRLGDFYEMFFDDAKLVSKELDLVLTGRDCGEEEKAPMCGVPFHSCDAYIARLIAKGYKVAICEQMEDPATAKGLVKRDVIRVITPGTIMDSQMLEEGKNNFICAVFIEDGCAGVAFGDISTGELFVSEQGGEERSQHVINQLGRFMPSEVLLSPQAASDQVIVDFIKNKLHSVIGIQEERDFEAQTALGRLHDHFKHTDEKRLGLDQLPFAARALGALLSYAYQTQKTDLSYMNQVHIYKKEQSMELSPTTVRNLELCETLRNKEKKGSLLWVLDKTKTAMGARHLRSWLTQPLTNVALINRRLNCVSELLAGAGTRSGVMEELDGVFDLERLMTRIVYGSANARDLRALAQTLAYVPKVRALIEGAGSVMLREIYESLDELRDIRDLIERAIVESPPFSVREGGMIEAGYHDEVDELRAIMSGGREYLAKIEQEQRQATGIKNLKVKYNKVFGYYIEVTKSYLDQVPEHYVRKQTLVNCERFITPELKELEGKVLGAQERVCTLEYELFNQIREKTALELDRIQKTAKALANLDVLCSLAQSAADNHYCMPQVDYSERIEIKEGRHPVVEKMLDGELFVPNDTLLDEKQATIAIITGPNMAGKSTYMRQVAIITLMAQIGSFVPASAATIGVVDQIFTRVGASDDLASGQSTFMLEMNEVADILKEATRKSLIIFDEIGRGTSTFDGMSIARAVLEYVADKKRLGAKTLFATHYHELTVLEEELPSVKNYNIAAKKQHDTITFLRRIVRGGADDSYGIEVAALAGVPQEVITRAKVILRGLEGDGAVKPAKAAKNQPNETAESQLSLSSLAENEIMARLRDMDVSTLTPIEALNILYEISNQAKKES